MNRNDDDKQDEGNVWASYSDLFTSVAIIFLVMFVFALIKAGVSSLQTVAVKKAHEKELKGELPAKAKKKNQKNLNKISKSIDQMNQYENLISQKVIEMNQFAKKLKENKTVFKDLIENQNRKDSILKVVRDKLEDKDIKLKNEKEKKVKLEQLVAKNKIAIKKVLALKESVIQKIRDSKERAQRLNLEKEEQLIQMSKEIESNRVSFDNKIIETQQEIKQLVKKQNIEKDQIVSNYEKKIEAIKNQTSSSLKVVKAQMVAMEDEKARDIANYEGKITQIITDKNKQIIDYKKKNVAIQSQKKKVLDQVSRKELEIEEASERQLHLQGQLKNKDIDIAKIQKTLRSQVRLVEKSKEKLSEIKKSKYNTEVELERASSRLKKQRQHEVSLLAKLEGIEQDLKMTQKKASNFQDLSRQYRYKSEKYLKDMKALRVKNHKLAKAAANVENGRAKLEKAKDQLGIKISDLNLQLKATKQKMGSSAQENEILERKLQKSLKAFFTENTKLKSDLAKSKNQHLKKVAGLELEVAGLSSNNKDLDSKLGSATKKIASLNDDFDSLKTHYSGQLDSLKASMALMKQKHLAQMGKSNGLSQKLKEQNIANSTCSSEREKLAKLVKDSNKNSVLSINDLKKKYNSCRNKSKYAQGQNKSLRDAVTNIGRKIASLKGDLRSSIAQKLANHFRGANILAKVDPITGNVTLDLGKNFLFRKNSHKIGRGAIKQLKKIIPIYGSVLFSDKKISQQISSFNIEGHASPIYKGKFLKQAKINATAYSYNMLLSGQRASSISSYMFSNRIGDYKYKLDLKKKTRAVGYGYTKPVIYNGSKKRSIAAENICYPFDCGLSQRVELSFTLKDDNDSLDKLFDITKDMP
jgi:hypothetical protein